MGWRQYEIFARDSLGTLRLVGFAPISSAQSAQSSSNTAAQSGRSLGAQAPFFLAGLERHLGARFPQAWFDPPAGGAILDATGCRGAKSSAGEEAKNEEPPTESANCLPPGMPTIMFQPYDVEFLFTPGRVTIIQEAYMQVRRVFTDGRRRTRRTSTPPSTATPLAIGRAILW